MNFPFSPHSGDLAFAFLTNNPPTATTRADFRRIHFISEVMLTMMVATDGEDMLTGLIFSNRTILAYRN